MSNLQAEEYKSFEEIKKTKENGTEYWSARELSAVLQYKKWENFAKVIDRAKLACINSGFEITEHFPEVRKTIKMPKNAEKEVIDYELSRYACYLIVQNGDPRKEVIALGQTYFAIQTRRQEVAEFQNAGYMGLYGGLTVEDIHTKKNLKENEKILDFMGSEELAANLFRITQTEAKLKRENVKTKQKANQTHYTVGTTVRKAIKDIGGTMPEDLPNLKKVLNKSKKNN